MPVNQFPDNLFSAAASIQIVVTYTAAAAAVNGGSTATYNLTNVNSTPEYKVLCDDIDRLAAAGWVAPT